MDLRVAQTQMRKGPDGRYRSRRVGELCNRNHAWVVVMSKGLRCHDAGFNPGYGPIRVSKFIYTVVIHVLLAHATDVWTLGSVFEVRAIRACAATGVNGIILDTRLGIYWPPTGFLGSLSISKC